MVVRPDHLPQIAYWDITAETVIGSAHRRQNKPCQDDFHYDVRPSSRCLVVADGHGSAKSPKSELGAQFAARKSIAQLQEFADGVSGKPFDVIKKYAEEDLPRRLVKGWIDTVQSREPERDDLRTLLLEYGSTLLSVLVTSRYILYLQLGDGDILRVAPNGTVTRPIPNNPRLFANETTSLSMVDKLTGQPNGWLEMTVVLEPIAAPLSAPALIVVSTDGYANSFSGEAGFIKVGPDILRMIQVDGWERVKRELPGWLKEATATGSGDDITVGLLWNSRARAANSKENDS